MQVMLSQPLVLCAILFFGSAAGRVGHAGPAAGPAAGPMAAPAGAPGGPAAAIPAVTCEFTIENLEYEAVAEHEEARDGIRDAVKTMIDGAIEAAVAAPAGAPGPSGAPPAGPAPAFIQLGATPKFIGKKAHQSALSHDTWHSVNGPAASPSASPAAPPAPNNVDTFVALSEGAKDTVQADAWTVAPADKMDVVESEMEKVCKPAQLANALLGAEGIKWAHAPVVTGCKVKTEDIERFQMDCAPHVKKIISRFTMAYTRAQVPHALEQACHLFESKISFSGNRRITKWDKRVCKKATEKLMKQWQGGKGKEDYDGWCQDICELKLGKGAPQCHV